MRNPIPPPEYELMQPLERGDGRPVKSMLELGNKTSGPYSYKAYFEALGIRHVSVDWNGRDGALALDLNQPIDLGERFCMVTNIGTTEHVSNQASVWENIDRHIDLGGVLVSTTPEPGQWPWHGFHYPHEAFFAAFAELNGYNLDRSFIHGVAPRRMVFARLTKLARVVFKMPAEALIYHNRECKK